MSDSHPPWTGSNRSQIYSRHFSASSHLHWLRKKCKLLNRGLQGQSPLTPACLAGLVSAFSSTLSHLQMGKPILTGLECPSPQPSALSLAFPIGIPSLPPWGFPIIASYVKSALSTTDVPRKEMLLSGAGIRKIFIAEVPFEMGLKRWVDFWKAKAKEWKSICQKQRHREQRPRGERCVIHSRSNKWSSLVLTAETHIRQPY